MLGELCRECLAASDGRHILRQGNAIGAEFFGGGKANVSLARGDINFRTLGDEPFGDPFADTARPARDESDAAIKPEKFCCVHVIRPF